MCAGGSRSPVSLCPASCPPAQNSHLLGSVCMQLQSRPSAVLSHSCSAQVHSSLSTVFHNFTISKGDLVECWARQVLSQEGPASLITHAAMHDAHAPLATK